MDFFVEVIVAETREKDEVNFNTRRSKMYHKIYSWPFGFMHFY